MIIKNSKGIEEGYSKFIEQDKLQRKKSKKPNYDDFMSIQRNARQMLRAICYAERPESFDCRDWQMEAKSVEGNSLKLYYNNKYIGRSLIVNYIKQEDAFYIEFIQEDIKSRKEVTFDSLFDAVNSELSLSTSDAQRNVLIIPCYYENNVRKSLDSNASQLSIHNGNFKKAISNIISTNNCYSEISKIETFLSSFNVVVSTDEKLSSSVIEINDYDALRDNDAYLKGKSEEEVVKVIMCEKERLANMFNRLHIRAQEVMQTKEATPYYYAGQFLKKLTVIGGERL